MSYIEDLNYYNDRRTRDNSPTTTICIDDEEIELPTKWQICNICNGDGKTVNPGIDCGGLTREDFLEDPDFEADYFSGVYDVPCMTCKGSGKVRVPDFDRLTAEQLEAYEEQEREEAEYQAICRAERMMGA